MADRLAVCAPCGKFFGERDEFLKCSGPCSRLFHRSSVNVSKTDYDAIITDGRRRWKCTRQDCKEQVNLTQLMEALSIKVTEAVDNVTIDLVADIIKTVTHQLMQFKADIMSVQASQDFIANKYDDLLKKATHWKPKLIEINQGLVLCTLMMLKILTD